MSCDSYIPAAALSYKCTQSYYIRMDIVATAGDAFASTSSSCCTVRPTTISGSHYMQFSNKSDKEILKCV